MQRTEIEKMRRGESPDFQSPELQASFRHAKELLARMRTMSTYSDGFRELLEQLIPGIPPTSVICPPFHCDHGHGIRLGHGVYINAGCTFLDGGWIRIGDHTLIGPAVQIYTPHHPLPHGPRACAPRHHRRRLLDWRRSDHLPRCHDRRSHGDRRRQRRHARYPLRLARRRQSLPRHPPIRGQRGRHSLPITHHNGP